MQYFEKDGLKEDFIRNGIGNYVWSTKDTVEVIDKRIFLLTDLDDDSAQEIIRKLFLLSDVPEIEEIEFYINSAGGDLAGAYSIIDVMKSIPQKVKTIVLGNAMSCAALIAVCGDERYCYKNSIFMFHSCSFQSITDCNERGMKGLTKEISRLNQHQIDILLEKTNLDNSQVEKAILDGGELYLSAEEAVDKGLVEGILDNK